MSTIDEDPEPPYMLESEGGALIYAYQSISSHPTFRIMSHEELRVKHYHSNCGERTPKSIPWTGSPKLMVSWQLSALALNYPLRPIRTSPDATHRYVPTENAYEEHR
jgi:hypothetical protein